MFLLVVVDLSGLSDLTMNPPFYRGAHQSRRKAVAHLCIVAVTSRLGSLGIFFFLVASDRLWTNDSATIDWGGARLGESRQEMIST